MYTGTISERIKDFLAAPHVITEDMSRAACLLYEALSELEAARKSTPLPQSTDKMR